MTYVTRFPKLFFAVALMGFAHVLCADTVTASSASATLKGDAAHPETAQWLRTELYFATGLIGDETHGITEAQWLSFLDKEVTPRFPDGLTVLDAYGQWRSRGKDTPNRLRSKVIVLLHENTETSRAAVEEIRSAWKTATGHQSVLEVNEKAEVSF
jgi:hypothetical protein